MEFGVLGPLQVNGGDVALPAKQRVLLAALLLRANRVVPLEALVDALWGDAPPYTARTTLQGYVKQLRQNADIRVGPLPRLNVPPERAGPPALGRHDEASDVWRAALPILDQLGDPRAAEVRARLGRRGEGRSSPVRDT